MIITTIRYGKKINLGNYESESFELEAKVENNVEDYEEVVEQLKKLVNSELEDKKKPLVTKETETIKVEEPVKKEEKPKEEKTEEKPKKTTRKRKPKKTTVTYDRTIDTHKKVLGDILDDNYKGWKKDESLKTKALHLSTSLSGKEEIFDSNGDVLESFHTLIKKGME